MAAGHEGTVSGVIPRVRFSSPRGSIGGRPRVERNVRLLEMDVRKLRHGSKWTVGRGRPVDNGPPAVPNGAPALAATTARRTQVPEATNYQSHPGPAL